MKVFVSLIYIEFLAPMPKKRPPPEKIIKPIPTSPIEKPIEPETVPIKKIEKEEELYCMTEEEAKQPYDPSKPNDYENILHERKKRRFEEELRRKKVQELKELEKDRLLQSEALDLNLTGEQAYLKRVWKTANVTGEEKALGMMKKMGWSGKGLGKEEQGITAPLMVKKTDKMGGVIVAGTKSELPKGTVLTTPATKVVQLTNINPEDADEDLRLEMIDGCKPYGNVLVMVCINFRVVK